MYGRYQEHKNKVLRGVQNTEACELAGSWQEDLFQISSNQDARDVDTFSGIETFCIKLSH